MSRRASTAAWRGAARKPRHDEPALHSVKVPGGEHWLEIGQAIGGVDESLKRQMIRRTIEEHLKKELRLANHGIKVLSLFFIDRVERYRKYDDAGNPQKGDYATWFEEEYRRLARHPDYRSLFKEVDLRSDAAEVHDGYFSRDKKGTWTDTAENNQGNFRGKLRPTRGFTSGSSRSTNSPPFP